MQKNYFVIECATLLAFENYEDARAYCFECFDNFHTPRAYKRENVQDYSEEYAHALIVKYVNGKLVQYGFSPITLL